MLLVLQGQYHFELASRPALDEAVEKVIFLVVNSKRGKREIFMF